MISCKKHLPHGSLICPTCIEQTNAARGGSTVRPDNYRIALTGPEVVALVAILERPAYGQAGPELNSLRSKVAEANRRRENAAEFDKEFSK